MEGIQTQTYSFGNLLENGAFSSKNLDGAGKKVVKRVRESMEHMGEVFDQKAGEFNAMRAKRMKRTLGTRADEAGEDPVPKRVSPVVANPIVTTRSAQAVSLVKTKLVRNSNKGRFGEFAKWIVPPHSLIFGERSKTLGAISAVSDANNFTYASEFFSRYTLLGVSLEDGLDAEKVHREHESRRHFATAVEGVVSLQCPRDSAKPFFFGDPVYIQADNTFDLNFYNTKAFMPLLKSALTEETEKNYIRVGYFVERVDKNMEGIRVKLSIDAHLDPTKLLSDPRSSTKQLHDFLLTEETKKMFARARENFNFLLNQQKKDEDLDAAFSTAVEKMKRDFDDTKSKLEELEFTDDGLKDFVLKMFQDEITAFNTYADERIAAHNELKEPHAEVEEATAAAEKATPADDGEPASPSADAVLDLEKQKLNLQRQTRGQKLLQKVKEFENELNTRKQRLNSVRSLIQTGLDEYDEKENDLFVLNQVLPYFGPKDDDRGMLDKVEDFKLRAESLYNTSKNPTKGEDDKKQADQAVVAYLKSMNEKSMLDFFNGEYGLATGFFGLYKNAIKDIDAIEKRVDVKVSENAKSSKVTSDTEGGKEPENFDFDAEATKTEKLLETMNVKIGDSGDGQNLETINDESLDVQRNGDNLKNSSYLKLYKSKTTNDNKAPVWLSNMKTVGDSLAQVLLYEKHKDYDQAKQAMASARSSAVTLFKNSKFRKYVGGANGYESPADNTERSSNTVWPSKIAQDLDEFEKGTWSGTFLQAIVDKAKVYGD